MTSFKILIVEDEILIADNIKRFLIKKGHQVVGIAISYEEAEALYLQKKPDICLLDIRLNGSKTGIDVARFIQNQDEPASFLFLTSQLDIENIENAKQTFPAGYLSKPVQKESLFTTIEIAMHKHLSTNEREPTIPLFDGTNNYIVKTKDILYLQAEHVYVQVHMIQGGYILQRSSLKELLQQLSEKQFLQIHRSYALNIKQVSHWNNESVFVGENELPVSRSRRKAVFSFLQTG